MICVSFRALRATAVSVGLLLAVAGCIRPDRPVPTSPAAGEARQEKPVAAKAPEARQGETRPVEAKPAAPTVVEAPPAIEAPPAVEALPPKADVPPAQAPAEAGKYAAPAQPGPKKEARTAAPAKPPLDLASLEKRLRDTDAIGTFTKLALKNQVDELIGRFEAHHDGTQKASLAELRQPFDLLIIKVLSLLQDRDAALAGAIATSREAMWGILSDPAKFRNFLNQSRS